MGLAMNERAFSFLVNAVQPLECPSLRLLLLTLATGCLQSSYGISSIRIEGMAVHSRPTPGDDVRIQGLTNAQLFKRVRNLRIFDSLIKCVSLGHTSKLFESPLIKIGCQVI